MMTQPSPSADSDPAADSCGQFPVETDILIRPDGSVVITDLPQELATLQALLDGDDNCSGAGESATEEDNSTA